MTIFHVIKYPLPKLQGNYSRMYGEALPNGLKIKFDIRAVQCYGAWCASKPTHPKEYLEMLDKAYIDILMECEDEFI